MDILGDHLLSPFLQRFLPNLRDRDLTGLRLYFWRAYSSKEGIKTEKPYRRPDVAFEDQNGRVIAFIESKWNLSVTAQQIVDEYNLCDWYSQHDPHVLVVTKASTKEIPVGIDTQPIDAGRLAFTTWRSINRWLRDIVEVGSDLDGLETRLIAEVSGLLDDLGQRESLGLKPEELERIAPAWRLANNLVEEAMILAADLRRDLESEGIVPLKQPGGQEVYREGTSRALGTGDWLPGYFLFPFGDRSWYRGRSFYFETGSFLYVVLFLDREEIHVGYWGNTREVAAEVSNRTLPDVDMPQFIPPYSGADWMEASRRADSVPLDATGTGLLSGEGNHFDLFYSTPLKKFRRGKEAKLRGHIREQLKDLRTIVVQLGLREV